MHSLSRMRFVLLFVGWIIVGVFFATNDFAQAQEIPANVAQAANAMCVPVIPSCPCGTKPGIGGCVPGANMFQCPCGAPIPGVEGGYVAGTCLATLKCEGLTYQGGGQPGGATDQGLQALQGIIDKALQALQQKGGGGGGGGGQPPQQTQDPASDFFNDQGVTRDLQDIVDQAKVDDPVTSILDSILNQNRATSTNTTNTQATTTAQATTTTQTRSTTTEQQQTPPQQVRSVVGSFVDSVVRTIGNAVTLVTSGREESTNTGVGGFFGEETPSNENAQEAQSGIVNRLCTARPWQTSFINRIFSSNFFDTLCASRGYAVGQTTDTASNVTTIGNPGRPQIQCPQSLEPGSTGTVNFTCGDTVSSAGTGFDTRGLSSGSASITPTQTTTYTLTCGRGGSVSCTVEVLVPTVEIVAHPQRVSLNTRSQIFWVAKGVSTCEVTGPGFRETRVQGSASTNAILDDTTYTISCRTAKGNTITDTTTVEVGL